MEVRPRLHQISLESLSYRYAIIAPNQQHSTPYCLYDYNGQKVELLILLFYYYIV